MELIEYKYIWNNLIILLTIYIIYLIYQNYKMTEEKFQAIINVHYEDKETNSAQTLYITYSDIDSIFIDYKRILSNIQNIIALFPSNVNSEEVFMLDSSHALYLVNSANKSSKKITFELIVDGEEYPVKVVTNELKAYALTNIGNIFEIENTIFAKKTLDDNKFLDFAVKNNDNLYMINTEGKLYKYSTTLTQLYQTEKYLQIIGLGDKVFVLNASSKNICEICEICDSDDSNEIISTVPLNVSLICNETYIGYYNISECNIYNYSLNEIKKLDYGFKFASLIDDHLVGIKNDDHLNKINLTTPTTPTTDVLVCSECSNILLFAGSEIANIFYIPFKDTNTRCPMEFVDVDCDLCDTTVVENDMNCGLIMDAIGTLINEY